MSLFKTLEVTDEYIFVVIRYAAANERHKSEYFTKGSENKGSNANAKGIVFHLQQFHPACTTRKVPVLNLVSKSANTFLSITQHLSGLFEEVNYKSKVVSTKPSTIS